MNAMAEDGPIPLSLCTYKDPSHVSPCDPRYALTRTSVMLVCLETTPTAPKPLYTHEDSSCASLFAPAHALTRTLEV